MNAILSATAIAGIAFVLGLICWKKKVWGYFTVIAFAIAGLGLSGGLLGDLLNRVGAIATNAGGSFGSLLFGVGIPVLGAFVLGLLIFLDWKNGVRNRTTAWYALLLPVLVIPLLIALGMPSPREALDALPALMQAR